MKLRSLALLAAAVTAFALAGPVSPASAVGALTVPIQFSAPVPAGVQVTVQVRALDGTHVQSRADFTNGSSAALVSLPDVAAGTYYVGAIAYGTGWAERYVGDVPNWEQATAITVTDGQTTTTPAITLQPAGTLNGSVSITGTAWDAAMLSLHYLDTVSATFVPYRSFHAESDGFYSITHLPPGTYRLRVAPDMPEFMPTWWTSAVFSEDATTFTVTAGAATTINPQLSLPRTLGTQRIAGATRFDANVAMTQVMFPPAEGPHNIPVLYIANGNGYPDALSAGPAAVHQGGALLLVKPTEIPAVVANEIDRLAPQRIIVAGGVNSVSAAVYSQLSASAPEIERIGGANRYEASRNIVRDAFGCATAPCVDSVFLATGANFPDALSAGPAAAKLDAPVLLVKGTASADTATKSLITELGAERAYIMGGTASVSNGFESSISTLGLGITRFAGANRYAAAFNLNAAIFGPTERAYVATGLGFADALAGGPLAGMTERPIYLSPPTCGTQAAHSRVLEYDIVEITYLGGPASIGDVFFSNTCGY